MKLYDDKRTITMLKSNGSWEKCYLSKWILISKNKTTKIRLKINYINSGCKWSLYIGLSTKDDLVYGTSNLYCNYSGDGGIRANPKGTYDESYKPFNNNDIITLSISFNGIKYYHNNELQFDGTKIEFDSKQKYKLVINTWMKQTCVTLLDITGEFV